MANRKIIPQFVIILFAIDFLFCFFYAVNFLMGSPSEQITRLLDLSGEMNLPTWYSSVQWFCAAFLFGIFAIRNFDWDSKRSWVLLLLPLVFLAFSIDEIAGIHEYLGVKSDALLPTGNRKDILFKTTGIWFVVLGIPVLLLCLFILSFMKKFLMRPPHVFRKMMIGVSIFFGGAIGMEILSNIPSSKNFGYILQNILEEGMEMGGVTVLLWAAHDLLLANGFTWHLDTVAPGSVLEVNPCRSAVGPAVPATGRVSSPSTIAGSGISRRSTGSVA